MLFGGTVFSLVNISIRSNHAEWGEGEDEASIQHQESTVFSSSGGPCGCHDF